MQLKSSSLLITGSNRGIGQAVALEAARRGARLLLANRTPNPQMVQDALKQGAPSAKEFTADLGSKAGIEAFLGEIKNEPVDILFNNAGQLTGGLLEDQPLEDIYSMIQVNVNALIHLTRHFVPKMIQQGRGKIINHGSVSSYMHFPCATTYSASKAAVAAFNECLKAELKGTTLTTLLLVTPGVETRMFREIEKKYSANLDTSFLASVPAETYARQVCDAIESDIEILNPTGSSRIGLSLARHTPGLFRRLAQSKFTRSRT
jgi:uncharacterized protein